MVEEYERPAWTFNKMIYIEKEGLNEALKEVRWAERHDCAVMSSKGFSTRAARDLIDKLAEHDEPVEVFCVHDADAYGTMIYQTLQEATKARGARKIKIVNLGLEPWEAIEMGLEVETVEEGERRKAVADYVLDATTTTAVGRLAADQPRRAERDDDAAVHRMARCEDGRARHGKLVPPPDVLDAELPSASRTRCAPISPNTSCARPISRAGRRRHRRDRDADADDTGGRASKQLFEREPDADGATTSRPWRQICSIQNGRRANEQEAAVGRIRSLAGL